MSKLGKQLKYYIAPVAGIIMCLIPLLLGTEFYKHFFISIGEYLSFYLVVIFTFISLFFYMTMKNNRMVLVCYFVCISMIFYDEIIRISITLLSQQ